MPRQSILAPSIRQDTHRLSSELQIGKAAEHLVCADLILQGYNAFLTDQGLPYDVVVDTPAGLRRIQVRSSAKSKTVQGRSCVYQFNTRRAKGNRRACVVGEADWYAFIAIDVRRVAYLRVSSLAGRDGHSVVQCIQFRSQASDGLHNGRAPGDIRAMRRMEDYGLFSFDEIR